MTIDISLRVAISKAMKVNRRLFRVPHDIERIDVTNDNFRFGGPGYRRGKIRNDVVEKGVPLPEVYRAFPDHTTPIGEAHQWLWRWINPGLSDDKFCTLFGNSLAWTNKSGFPGRRNYIQHKDMTAKLPNFHAVILNGGAVLEGEKVGSKVYLKTLLVDEPVPPAVDVLDDRTRWFYGTSVNPRGEVNYMTKLGTVGYRIPVRVLILTRYPIWLPAEELHELPPGMDIPDARWLA